MQAQGRQFLKNGVCLALAALLMRTVSVSFGAYVSEKIGASGMGLYSLIMSIYTLAVTIATSGVQLATTRLVSEALGRVEEGAARAALRLAVRYAVICGTIAAAVLFFGATARFPQLIAMMGDQIQFDLYTSTALLADLAITVFVVSKLAAIAKRR